MTRLKTILLGFTIFLTPLIIIPTLAFFSVEKNLENKLDAKKFLPTTEFYTTPVVFHRRQQISSENIQKIFLDSGFRQREPQQFLLAGDFMLLSHSSCLEKYKKPLTEEITHCLVFINKDVQEKDWNQNAYSIWIKNNTEINSIRFGLHDIEIDEAPLAPQLFAQYTDNKPIMQSLKSLGEIPPQCLNAVMSIEDTNFLEHSGFSLSGMARALYKNIVSGRRGQGGSTITQQLVKNYFLSSERSFKRKALELVMSILLESKYSKDEILETYLNIIYMGQNGPFQVIGFGAAAPFYFGKEIQDLKTHECALLAAVLNGPGVYDPWSKKEKSLKRRNLVLSKMLEFNYITQEEFQSSSAEPLPSQKPKMATETAPYFIDAVKKQMAKLSIPAERSKVYTYLDLNLQQAAQEALQKHLANLESQNKKIKNLKEKGLNLEGVVLSGEPHTGAIQIAVGGRSYRMTQFNRAVDGHRQIGSIMKPFVYLTALQKGSASSSERKYTPLTLVNDEKFEIKYEGQSWSPDNYSKKYYGQVPLFYALKNSLNASTAAVGLDVGLSQIIETVRAYGVNSDMKPVPSLTLGAFEMYPTEVLRAYMGLSQFGSLPEISFIQKVKNSDDKVIFEHHSLNKQVSDKLATASLVSMMKQTILSGTAHNILTLGFDRPAAGKTGTTSDFKDAWFAGFTPFRTTITWVGYDNNTSSGLTGGSGAAPIWADLMKKISLQDPAEDFSWPENSRKEVLTPEKLFELGAKKEAEDDMRVELILPVESH